MGLKIVKKKNPNIIKKDENITVITILGMIDSDKAEYNSKLNLKTGKYKNMLPLLLDNFKNNKNTTIIPIYTKEALEKQKNVISEYDFKIEENGKEINDKNFDAIFNTINEILSDENYTEYIIDISHGFRHLPILATVSMLINNFQDASKISKILFAKEVKPRKRYEIIDLKDYLEIANISFVLNTFDDNYTVANHIKSKKFNNLINALNDFSNDIMALNLSNLNDDSLPQLCKQLEKIDDISIKTMAIELKHNLEKDFKLQDKRYLTYYNISRNLLEKNYILPSLSMLYESIRMYIKTSIKKDEYAIVVKIENFFDNDLYKLGDFFKNLEWKDYDKLKQEKKIISEFEYKKLQESFSRRMTTSSLMKDISNTRNDLSHANAKSKFSEIKDNTQNFINRYEKQYNLNKLIK